MLVAFGKYADIRLVFSNALPTIIVTSGAVIDVKLVQLVKFKHVPLSFGIFTYCMHLHPWNVSVDDAIVASGASTAVKLVFLNARAVKDFIYERSIVDKCVHPLNASYPIDDKLPAFT